MEPLAHQVVPDVMFILFFFREDLQLRECMLVRVWLIQLICVCPADSLAGLATEGFAKKNALCQDQLLVAPIHTQARVGYCHWRVDKIDKALRRQLMECSTSNVTTQCEDSLLATSTGKI